MLRRLRADSLGESLLIFGIVGVLTTLAFLVHHFA